MSRHSPHLLIPETLTDYSQVFPPQPKTTTATKTPVTASTSVEVQDPASEDELKNEASFHSAAESQSELEVKGVPKTGSEVTNHGTDVRAPEASTAIIIPTPAPPAPTTHSTQEATNAPTEQAPAITTMGDQQSEQESKAATVPSTTSEAADVSTVTEQETKMPTTVTLVVGQKKKGGPQQTESMHPMSQKQVKAQAKKDREKKKKADKKDKLANKGKGVDKSASNQAPPADEPNEKTEATTDKIDAPKNEAKPVGDVQSVDASPTPFATTPDAKETSASGKKLDIAERSQKLADDTRGKSAKGKGKKAGTPAAKELASTEDNNENQGKQTNGTSVTPETGSVTNKDTKANSKEAMQQTPTEEITQESAPGTDAQSSKQDDSKEVNSGDPGSDPSGAGVEGTTPSGKKKKNKKKKKIAALAEGEGEASKQPLAWPNLDFRPKSPNPAWMGPIDMENDVQNYKKIMDEACGGSDDSDFSWSDLPTMKDVLSSDKAEASTSPADGSVSHSNTDADEEVRIFNALWPKLKKLRPSNAAETFARLSENNTMKEMAKLYVSFLTQPNFLLTLLLSVTDDATLVAKVDAATQPSNQFKNADDEELKVRAARDMIASSNREELINRGIAALNAQIGKQNSSVLDYPSLTSTDAKQEKMTVAGAEGSAGHDLSDTVSPDTQPPKKKKANKHKNKKKKKAVENGEASQSGVTVVPTATASIPSKAAADPVGPLDSFARQLNHVDAVIGLNQDEAAAPGSVSLRGGAATPVSLHRIPNVGPC